MLEPAKLAATAESKLPGLLAKAAAAPLPAKDQQEILDWLRAEWSSAKRAHDMLDPLDLDEWALNRYAFSEGRERQAKDSLLAVAHCEFSERKRAKVDPLFSSLGSASKGLVGSLLRTSRDDAEREKWALKALEILRLTG